MRRAGEAFLVVLAWLWCAPMTFGEEVPGLDDLARALATHGERPSALAVPEVDPARVADLERIGRDPSRSPAERGAALVMLGRRDPGRRDEAFREICDGIAPMHVHPAESFVGALKGLPFGPDDLPALAYRGLVPGGRPHDPFQGMALAAAGLVDDPRALDILLLAPDDAFLGDAGRIRDPVFHGLVLLCRSEPRRDALWEWCARTPGPSAARSRAILALATHRDGRAVEPMAALIRGLAPRPEAPKPPPDERNPGVPLPRALAEHHVFDFAAEWGEPRLGAAIVDHVYAGGTAAQAALAAASACGASLDKDRLWPLLDLDRPTSDQGAILETLSKLLVPEDAARVAALLARERWAREDFYVGVSWTVKVTPRLRSLELRDALIAIAREHPNAAVRHWAIEALSPFEDEKTAKELGRLLEEEPSEVVLEVILDRSKDPWTVFLLAFDGPNRKLRVAALRHIEWRFQSSAEGYDPTPAQKAELVRRSLARLAAPEAGDDPAHILRALYMLLVASPLNHPATRSPDLDEALLGALAKRCEAGVERDVAIQTANCLWALGGERARELLRTLAERNGDEEVRRFAGWALEQMAR